MSSLPKFVAKRKGFDSFLEAKVWIDTQRTAGRFVIWGTEQSRITKIEPAGGDYIIVWLERSDEFPIEHKQFAIRASLRMAGNEFWSNPDDYLIPVAERHWLSESKLRKVKELLR